MANNIVSRRYRELLPTWDGFVSYTIERQRRRYQAGKGSARNLGPSGNHCFGFTRRWSKCSWVVEDVRVVAGTCVGNRMLKDDATIVAMTLSERLYSRGSAKKALARLREAHPKAYIMTSFHVVEHSPASPSHWSVGAEFEETAS